MDFRVIDDLSSYRQTVRDVVPLFERVFERRFPSDVWDQWYFSNPYGDPLVVMAYADGQAVAHHALIPQVLVNARGTLFPYTLSISSMVDKRWRSWTVFSRMMDLLHEAAAKRGCPLIMVLPNAKSSELYRVLYHYRTLLETPLCVWHPVRDGNSFAIQVRSTNLVPTDDFSYPVDATYWAWRASVNGARCIELTDSSKVVVKISEDNVLTVLDLVKDPSPGGAAQLSRIAQVLAATSVRLTALHAEALGIPERELFPHEGYTVRLACLPLSDDIPPIRFSLLLSDVF
jgi:hypothetical protein